MTFYAENETTEELDFDWKKIYEQVAEAVLNLENCPYEVEVSLLLTDNENIRVLNRENREIDRETDVLSFPNVEFESPSDWEAVEEKGWNCFEPDTGELILGDIVVSVEKIREQAESYGHSRMREFAFLVAHSMLHLCGYDHRVEKEEKEMFGKQEEVLGKLNLTRD